MEDARLLIVNADDYGRTPEISRGILAAFAAGVLKSTTVLANAVTDEKLKAALDCGIACGLHFNLTFGKPISAVPADLLGAGGAFDKSKARDFPPDLTRAELDAQWDFLVSRGVAPTHIDSHHHIHGHPQILAAVAEFALRRGLPVRPCSEEAALYLRKLSIACPEEFSRDFYGEGRISREDFLKIIEKSKARSLEVMAHPGISSPALEMSSAYSKERETELSVLADARLLDSVSEIGWTCGSYLDL